MYMSIIPCAISSHKSCNNFYMWVLTLAPQTQTHYFTCIYAYAYIFQFQSLVIGIVHFYVGSKRSTLLTIHVYWTCTCMLCNYVVLALQLRVSYLHTSIEPMWLLVSLLVGSYLLFIHASLTQYMKFWPQQTNVYTSRAHKNGWLE